jgi:hypothetical protein
MAARLMSRSHELLLLELCVMLSMPARRPRTRTAPPRETTHCTAVSSQVVQLYVNLAS